MNWRHLIFFALLWPGAVLAADLALVAQRDLPEVNLSRADAADLFLGKRRLYADTVALSPLDVADEMLRERFYQAIAGLSSNRVRGYWAKQVFAGRSRPPRELGMVEAGAAVVREKGAVTYLPVDKVPAGSRVLLRIAFP